MSDKHDPFQTVTVRCKNARQFLHELDETHERWGDGKLWIYRGHNDAKWELIPSLFRDWDIDTVATYEIELIRLFVQNANLANLPIPSDSLGYVSRAKKGIGILSSTTVHDRFGDALIYDFTHVVFAIAQHSGVPTRLLDFSFDPMVAAYFASEFTNLYHSLKCSPEWKERYFDDIFTKYQQSLEATLNCLEQYIQMFAEFHTRMPDELAVWAINVAALHSLTTLRVLDHPYSEILNLRAQMGLFVCDTERYEYEFEPWRSFSEQLPRLVEERGIYKLTLPLTELEHLRRLLAKKRYFPGLMTPSYDLVAKAAKSVAQKYRYNKPIVHL